MYKTKNGEKVTYEIGQTNMTKYTKQTTKAWNGAKNKSPNSNPDIFVTRSWSLFRMFYLMVLLLCRPTSFCIHSK